MDMIEVTVNGAARSVDEQASVAWLVDDLAAGRRGVAVAINSEIVSRSAWESTMLAAGDRIEVLRAIQGGC
jgi:sulfur carrier protein